MLVRLTEQQLAWVRRSFVGHPAEARVDWWIQRADTRVGHSLDLVMPPDAFNYAAGWLFQQVYTTAGGRRSSAGVGMRAHRRVQTAVNNARRHPAFAGAAMLGTHSELLTGWRGPGKLMSPVRSDYPHPTSYFTVLVPKLTKWSGSRVTVWEPKDPRDLYSVAEDPLLDEREHVCFC